MVVLFSSASHRQLAGRLLPVARRGYRRDASARGPEPAGRWLRELRVASPTPAPNPGGFPGRSRTDATGFSGLSTLAPSRIAAAALENSNDNDDSNDDSNDIPEHRTFFSSEQTVSTGPPMASASDRSSLSLSLSTMTISELADDIRCGHGSFSEPTNRRRRAPRTNALSNHERKTVRASTAIEPAIRSRPFRSHRNSSGSSRGSNSDSSSGNSDSSSSNSDSSRNSNSDSSSSDWNASNNPFRRSPPPAYRRIVVNPLGSSNDPFRSDETHREPQELQRSHREQNQTQQQKGGAGLELELFGNLSSAVVAGAKPSRLYGSYPVIGVQVARSIDLSAVVSNVLAARGVSRKTRERLSVVAQLPPGKSSAAERRDNDCDNDCDYDSEDAARFVAVFRFGSVVCFNVSPKDVAELVRDIQKHSNGSLSEEEQRKDRFCVHVQPPTVSTAAKTPAMDEDFRGQPERRQEQRQEQQELEDDTIHRNRNRNRNNHRIHHRNLHAHDNNRAAGDDELVTADYCIVPELNTKSVDVISSIMAQSVALDAYNDIVDRLLNDFERINHKVTVEGNLSHTDRDKMFRSVARINAIFLQLTKVGIKDRDNTAWNLSQYEDLMESMREEFDIDRRFEHIEFKLNLIQQNAKFFLEVLANQKSDSLEWIIIVLISLECVLMCVEMSGMGEPLFGYLGQFVPGRPSPS